MLKRLLLFVLILFFAQINTLFAQNSNINGNIIVENNQTRDIRLNLTVNANLLQTSPLTVEFTNGRNPVLVEVKNNNRNLWLKESDQVPQQAGVVHWQRVDSLLILRVAPQTVSGSDLQLTVRMQARNKAVNEILVKTYETLPTNIKGRLAGQARLPILPKRTN